MKDTLPTSFLVEKKNFLVNNLIELKTGKLKTGEETDFVLKDKNINVAGGLHTIQPLFSEEKFEEIQIKGRAAR